MYCSKCGKELRDGMEICGYCGYNMSDNDKDKKSWITTFLLSLLLGIFGAHRFYTGYTAIGVIQILTLGGCGIWSLIDFASICFNKFRDSKNNKLQGYVKPLGIAMFFVMLLVIFFNIVIPITLPTALRSNTNERLFVIGSKLAESTLNQAIAMSIALDNKDLTNLTSEQMTDYFANRMNATNRISPTKFETTRGMTFEFTSSGSCDNGGCSVIVDTNGAKEPNKIWTENSKPQDQIIMKLTRNTAELPLYVLHAE